MASIKISELEEVTTLSESDTLPITNEGDTKQVAISKLGDILATKEYVNKTVGELADMGFTPIIVESLPTENIQTNTIYMIRGEDGEDENIYEEWMYINNTWEKVGSTGVGSSSLIKEYVWDLNATNYMNSDNITLTNAQKTSLISVLNQIITDGSAPYYNLIVINSNSTAVNTVGNKYHIISDNHSSKSYKLAFLGTSASNKTLELSGISFKTYTGKELPYVHKMAMELTGVYTNTSGLITSITTGTITTANGAIAVYGSDWSERPPQSSNDPITLGYLSNNTLTKTNTTTYTPTADYHPATKKYVDDAIAAIEVPEGGGGNNITTEGIYRIEVTSTSFSLVWSTTSTGDPYEFTPSELTKISEICTSAYQDVLNGIQPVIYIMQKAMYPNESFNSYAFVRLHLDATNPTIPPTSFNFFDVGTRETYPQYIMHKGLSVNGSWADGVFTASKATYKCINLNFSNKTVYWDNQSTFVPIGDYNPATKKYVDDSITTAITSVLEAEY